MFDVMAVVLIIVLAGLLVFKEILQYRSQDNVEKKWKELAEKQSQDNDKLLGMLLLVNTTLAKDEKIRPIVEEMIDPTEAPATMENSYMKNRR